MWVLRTQPRPGAFGPLEPQDRLWVLRTQPRPGAFGPLEPQDRLWVLRTQPRPGGDAPFDPPKMGEPTPALRGYHPLKYPPNSSTPSTPYFLFS